MAGVCVDLVREIDRLPERGGEAMARGGADLAGGGFNAMVAARRGGLAVAYGAGLGTGPRADIARRALEGLGAAIPLGVTSAADQGDCIVLVEPSGERSFVSCAGAEYGLSDADLARLDPRGFDWILVSGYALAVEGAGGPLARWIAALPPGAPLVFDPSPVAAAADPAALALALRRARWLSCNRAEAAALAGDGPPARMATALLAGPCAAADGVVVRCGPEGCVVALPGRSPVAAPGHPVAAVDTTGAGDAHVGAFLAALAAGDTALRAARRANVAAALSATRRGPATAPEAGEVAAALANAERPPYALARPELRAS
jgi:sugar/nucleoside kinase (ribokinase family)